MTGIAVHIAVATARSGRPRNEDAVGIGGWVLSGDAPRALDVVVRPAFGQVVAVAVTDGVGASAAGHVAAQVAAAELTRLDADDGSPITAYAEQPLRVAALTADALFRADEMVRAIGIGPRAGMGCAAAVLMIGPTGSAAIGNVGDVRAYRIRDSYAGVLTVDDRLADKQNVLTACLGGHSQQYVTPHLFEIELHAGERLLLCSDGLHDVLDTGDIGRLAVGPLPSAAQVLVDTCLDKGPGDNVTAVIADVVHGSDSRTISAC